MKNAFDYLDPNDLERAPDAERIAFLWRTALQGILHDMELDYAEQMRLTEVVTAHCRLRLKE